MTQSTESRFQALSGANFGYLVNVPAGARGHEALSYLAEGDWLLDAFYAGHGLLVVRGMQGITEEPELLVRMAHLFGPDVEDCRAEPNNIWRSQLRSSVVHPDVPEILVLSNARPPSSRDVRQPAAPGESELAVRFPRRRGWHTDRSFRSPPPDVTLLYAETPCPRGQGQTLYADGVSAYRALPEATKRRIEHLEGLHVWPGKGRAEWAVRAGENPTPLGPGEQPQRQPVVRRHPVTGELALYLCDHQMDWVDGPLVGMEPGVDGDGARLLYELLTHYTDPRFTYVHEWDPGDVVIHDNRSTIHAATWFDAQAHRRCMWRLTVGGHPGF